MYAERGDVQGDASRGRYALGDNCGRQRQTSERTSRALKWGGRPRGGKGTQNGNLKKPAYSYL